MRAIAAKPHLKSLTGAATVRVPSGKIMSCPPCRRSAAESRSIRFGPSLRMYCARRAPAPSSTLSSTEAFMMQLRFSSREIRISASTTVGWLGAMIIGW